ncbi:hypothetical protein PCE1_002362 [Barthelona sp. PCE]
MGFLVAITFSILLGIIVFLLVLLFQTRTIVTKELTSASPISKARLGETRTTQLPSPDEIKPRLEDIAEQNFFSPDSEYSDDKVIEEAPEHGRQHVSSHVEDLELKTPHPRSLLVTRESPFNNTKVFSFHDDKIEDFSNETLSTPQLDVVEQTPFSTRNVCIQKTDFETQEELEEQKSISNYEIVISDSLSKVNEIQKRMHEVRKKFNFLKENRLRFLLDLKSAEVLINERKVLRKTELTRTKKESIEIPLKDSKIVDKHKFFSPTTVSNIVEPSPLENSSPITPVQDKNFEKIETPMDTETEKSIKITPFKSASKVENAFQSPNDIVDKDEEIKSIDSDSRCNNSSEVNCEEYEHDKHTLSMKKKKSPFKVHRYMLPTQSSIKNLKNNSIESYSANDNHQDTIQAMSYLESVGKKQKQKRKQRETIRIMEKMRHHTKQDLQHTTIQNMTKYLSFPKQKAAKPQTVKRKSPIKKSESTQPSEFNMQESFKALEEMLS